MHNSPWLGVLLCNRLSIYARIDRVVLRRNLFHCIDSMVLPGLAYVVVVPLVAGRAVGEVFAPVAG